MSPTSVFLLVCVQACLVQNACSQCFGAPAIGLGYGGCAGPTVATGPYAAGIAGCVGPAYGGTGTGNVAVTGALPVAGITSLAGQVPIIGSVSFGGPVPAAGAVTISGSCACGCGAPSAYGFY